MLFRTRVWFGVEGRPDTALIPPISPPLVCPLMQLPSPLRFVQAVEHDGCRRSGEKPIPCKLIKGGCGKPPQKAARDAQHTNPHRLLPARQNPQVSSARRYRTAAACPSPLVPWRLHLHAYIRYHPPICRSRRHWVRLSLTPPLARLSSRTERPTALSGDALYCIGLPSLQHTRTGLGRADGGVVWSSSSLQAV